MAKKKKCSKVGHFTNKKYLIQTQHLFAQAGQKTTAKKSKGKRGYDLYKI